MITKRMSADYDEALGQSLLRQSDLDSQKRARAARIRDGPRGECALLPKASYQT